MTSDGETELKEVPVDAEDVVVVELEEAQVRLMRCPPWEGAAIPSPPAGVALIAPKGMHQLRDLAGGAPGSLKGIDGSLGRPRLRFR